LSDDGTSVEFKNIPFDEREMRLATMPEVFHLPDGSRGRGIYARLSTLDEATLRDLLLGRWRSVAPKSLVREFDSYQAGTNTR
jgi:hypothetical protein